MSHWFRIISAEGLTRSRKTSSRILYDKEILCPPYGVQTEFQVLLPFFHLAAVFAHVSTEDKVSNNTYHNHKTINLEALL